MARAGPAPKIVGPGRLAPAKAVVTAAAIASDGMRYAGRGYVFGGNASAPGDWDCSSFVSYVLGHDLGLALPGGRWGDPGFPPGSHGPVVTSYAGWPGAVPVQEPQAGAGDLVLWVGVGAGGHMGIVLGPDKMVSALNPQLGTLVSPITGYGPLGVNPVYRRIVAAAPGGTVTAAATGAGGGANMLLPLLAGGLIAAGMTLAVLGLAAVVSVGAAALAGAAARRAMAA